MELTFQLDSVTFAKIEEGAALRGMSVGDYVAELLRHIAAQDAALRASIKEATDDLDAGGGISQDEMEAWFAARRRPAAAE